MPIVEKIDYAVEAERIGRELLSLRPGNMPPGAYDGRLLLEAAAEIRRLREASTPALSPPMTLERAVEVLNRRRHAGHDGWYDAGPFVLGKFQYEGFQFFEAIAIAEKYEASPDR